MSMLVAWACDPHEPAGHKELELYSPLGSQGAARRYQQLAPLRLNNLCFLKVWPIIFWMSPAGW